jgi:molybdenum cofactor synthesis domain-containing protein
MKSVCVEEAVGMVLGHDITRIVRGETKGRAFKKGHVIKGVDIEALLDLGKKHIYVWDLQADSLHEDDAARAIAHAAVGSGIALSEPKEGKIELTAEYHGLLTINVSLLERLNSLDDIILASIHTNQVVAAGKKLAGTRVIPLTISREAVNEAVALLQENSPLVEVKKLSTSKVGIITTGSEVYEGRIKDQFGPVLREKFSALGCDVIRQVVVPDDAQVIADSIKKLIAEGADFIATTGGMSVDPDDVTPEGIRQAGGEIITYGAPVLPGAMFCCPTLTACRLWGCRAALCITPQLYLILLFPGFWLARNFAKRISHRSGTVVCAPDAQSAAIRIADSGSSASCRKVYG